MDFQSQSKAKNIEKVKWYLGIMAVIATAIIVSLMLTFTVR